MAASSHLHSVPKQPLGGRIAFIPGGHNCGAGGEVYAVVPLPT